MQTNHKSSRLSIGLPVYNGENFLALALDSVLSQDFEDFELIISDNASIDSTQEICTEYAKKDHRIRYFRNRENIGSSINYNQVFRLASGEYFKWFAHDDLICAGLLTKCMEVMRSASANVTIVYPGCSLIDESGNVLEDAPREFANTFKHPYRRLARVLRTVGYAYPLWGLIRSSHLRRTRLLKGGAQDDYVLLAELSLQGEFWELNEVLFKLRMHKRNAWGICSEEQGDSVFVENAKANRRSRKRMAIWTDPKLADKQIYLPFYEELYYRYLKGVAFANLPILQKLLCYITVPVVCYFRRLKNYGAIWKRRFVKTIHHNLKLFG